MPNINLPQMRTFDLGKAMAQGNRNAINEQRSRFLPEQQRMQQRQFEMAEQTHQQQQKGNEIQQALQAINYAKKSADLVNGPDTYKAWADDMIKRQIIQPEQLPETYDPNFMANFQDRANKQIQKYSDYMQVPNAPQGTMGQQNLTTKEWDIKQEPGGSSGRPTALMQNIPFLAKSMGISTKEAASILTNSKDKSPQGVYGTLYGSMLRSGMWSPEEAEKVASDYVAKVFGEEWRDLLPKNRGKKRDFKQQQPIIEYDPVTGNWSDGK